MADPFSTVAEHPGPRKGLGKRLRYPCCMYVGDSVSATRSESFFLSTRWRFRKRDDKPACHTKTSSACHHACAVTMTLTVPSTKLRILILLLLA